MPPKGKADTAGYQQLKKDLSAQAPGKLYILHGEETYLRDYCLNQLKELILSGGMGTFNFHEIPAKEMSPRRLEEALDCLPMMAQRTLVQVTDFDLFKAGEKDREEYARAFAQLPDYCCLVFVYDTLAYKRDARMKKLAGVLQDKGQEVPFLRQETGDLVDWIQDAYGVYDGIVLNPGAYTHTSIALLDALLAVGIPTVEVHLSDLKTREPFRQISYIRPACAATFMGLGIEGYRRGMEFLEGKIRQELHT